MNEKKCLDCKKDISRRGWLAKRCKECSNKRQLNLQKIYRDNHKKEIREYQNDYYSKK